MKTYVFEPYDVLEISRDGGKSWTDYFVIKTEEESREAMRYVGRHSQSKVERYRICRDHGGRSVVFGE